MSPTNNPIIVESQFKIIADTAPVLIWLSGTDKQCYFFNAGWLRFTGRSMEEECGDGWALGVHPDDLENCLKTYHEYFDLRKEFQIEYRLRRHDGCYRWVVDNGVPRYDENGHFAGYIGSCMDIDQILETQRFKRDYITSESLKKEKDLNEQLIASNQELSSVNEELKRSEENLQNVNNNLEEKVAWRVLELSESEDRFRNMAESTDTLIAVADENGKGVYFNKAWLQLTGKIEEDLLSLGWTALIHPDDKKEWLQIYFDASARQKPVNGEFRILDHSGNYRWLLASVPPRFRPDGSFAGYISSCIDITDRKKYELQLENIINILPASVVVISGPDLIVERINQSNLNYWNKSKEQVLGKPLLDILPELENQAFPGQLKHVMETGEIIDVKQSPVKLINPDGSERLSYVDYTYQPIPSVDGKHNTVLVMSFELTKLIEQRQQLQLYGHQMQLVNEALAASNEELATLNAELLAAQKKIYESETALRLAIEAANFGTWYINSKTVELSSNNRLKELFGFHPEETLTIENALERVTAEYRHQVKEALENAIYKGNDFDVVYPVIGLNDNKLRWLRSIGSQMSDITGAFTAFTGVAMDITEQKLNEIRKNDFIGMVSHELKTPLTSLTLSIQMLGLKLEDYEEEFITSTLLKAERQVKKMNALINGFLNISRLESSELQIVRQDFELVQVIADAIEETWAANTAYDIHFKQTAPIMVNGDKEKISSVISNLLSNAMKYSPYGTFIEVSGIVKDGEAIVCVKDEGLGIREADLEKIFDRYYRVEDNRKKFISGFGIGLYLCSEIIRKHNGRIWVESEFGKGSSFYFALPL